MSECSVIIATRDRLAYLRQALDSALSQQDIDLEVIVVADAGCADGTFDYLAEIADPRLVVMSCEKVGVAAPRNMGMRQARSEWLALLDDDDLWAPRKLRAQLDSANASGRQWAYTGGVQIDGESRLIGGRPPSTPDVVVEMLTQGGCPLSSSLVWQPAVLGDDRWFDPGLNTHEDLELCMRLARHGPPAFVPEPLMAYREHETNRSLSVRPSCEDLSHIEHASSELRFAGHVAGAPWCTAAGAWAYHAGRRGEALRYYLRAVRLGAPGAAWRALGVALPKPIHRRVRRRLLADESWMRQAETWLDRVQEHGLRTAPQSSWRTGLTSALSVL